MTLCVLLWAIDGRIQEMSDYEDRVLALIAEHGGRVANRLRNLAQDEGPTEIHVLEFPSERALNEYMSDGRRLALAADRERSIARTDVLRVQPICDPRSLRRLPAKHADAVEDSEHDQHQGDGESDA